MDEKLKGLLDDMNASFKTLQEKGATKEELVAMKAKMDEVSRENADEIKRLTSIIKEQGEAIQDFKDYAGTSFKSEYEQIKEFITENIDKISDIADQKHGFVDFELKGTVAPILTTTNGSVVGTPSVDSAVNVNYRRPSLMPFFANGRTSKVNHTYNESVPKDGDFGFIAEGTKKPQVDFIFKTVYLSPKKVAGFEVISEEARDDVAYLMSVARTYLRDRHDLKIQKGLLTGDGSGQNPEGAFTIGRSFNAGDMAGAVENPTLVDALYAAATDIRTTHNFTDEEPYKANVALVNPIDFFLGITSAKDGDGKAMYPVGVNAEMINIGGLTIVADEDVPAGKMFVGDLSKYHYDTYKPFSLRIGWHNDDFIKNQFVLLGESRFFSYVKMLDRQAFLYDDIATVKTAITKAASTKTTPSSAR